MSTDSSGLTFDLIGKQVDLIVGVESMNVDSLAQPFFIEERGEQWWVVESSEAEADHTRAYLKRHVRTRPLGWDYQAVPCTMDDLLALRQEISPPPVGFIHHLGWGANRFLPGLAIPAGRKCDESKIWGKVESGSHTIGPCSPRGEPHDSTPSIAQTCGSNDMDPNGHNTASACAVCGGSRWWSSRTGARVCRQCYPDAMAALQALADQLSDESQAPCTASLADCEGHPGPGSVG
jgi:hypothetical protein